MAMPALVPLPEPGATAAACLCPACLRDAIAAAAPPASTAASS
jgi:hypothetical protein